LSILLTAISIGTSGRLRVVDRLLRLRLHAVVGGHDDDRDVGHAGAAGAHGGERLVARGVEERDEVALVALDLVGADVLGDAAGLARDDLRLADRVEQRRLAVVDVAHDRDDGRALLEVGGIVDDDLLDLLVVGRADDLDLALELAGEDLDGLVGERLRERRHLAHHHQLLDDLGHVDAEALRDVLDRRARVDPDDVGALLGVLVDRRHLLRLEVAATAAAAAALLLAALRALVRTAAGTAGAARAAPCGLRVDDDAARTAPGAAGTRAAAALAHARVVAGRARAGPARATLAGAAGALAVRVVLLLGALLGLLLGPLLGGAGLARAHDALAGAAGAERARGVAAAHGGRGGAVAVRLRGGRLDLLAREGVGGELLVDRRGDRLHGQAGSLELGEHVPGDMSRSRASSWTRFLAISEGPV
jgi:hypothetical protein